MERMKVLCKMLNIRYPFIQGGMIGVAMAKLAAAVSDAGGLGQISAGGVKPEVLREELKKVKSLTDKPIGVNVPLREGEPNMEQLQVSIEEGVRVFALSGNPKPVMPFLKENKVIVMQLVASVKHARYAEKLGVDAVIAEGFEAAGNNGVFELTTLALVPQVVDAVSIPVIAAGGIGDGRGMMASFAMGAAGVQLGTRLLVADECECHEAFKDAVVKAIDTDTVVIGRSQGIVRRVLKTPVADFILQREKEGASLEEILSFCRGEKGIAASMRGELDKGLIYVGQVAGLVKEKSSVEKIFRDMIANAMKVKEALAVLEF